MAEMQVLSNMKRRIEKLVGEVKEVQNGTCAFDGCI